MFETSGDNNAKLPATSATDEQTSLGTRNGINSDIINGSS